MGKRLQHTFHRIIIYRKYPKSNKHVKRCSALSHQESSISEVKSPVKPNACEDIKQHKMSNIASRSIKWHTHFGEQFASSYTIKQRFPRDPPVPLLVIHPQEMKTFIHRNTCPRMFTAALPITAKMWK